MESKPPPAGFAPRGTNIWPLFHFSLWLNAGLLAGALAAPAWGAWAVWCAVFAAVCAFSAIGRNEIHDVAIELNYRERLAMLVLFIAVVCAPRIFGGSIAPHGLLAGLAALLLVPVTRSLAYRLFFFLLVGGWVAAGRADSPLRLALLAAFAVAWLFAIGMTHLAYVAEEHGLRGWRPAARVARAALATALPAGVAAALAWGAMEDGGWIRGTHPVAQLNRAASLAERLPPLTAMQILWQAVLHALVLAVTIALLYLLRRWMLRRQPGDPELLPGQETSAEYLFEHPLAANPSLPGVRGRIVRLWGKWAAAESRAGRPRASGETAAEFERRVAAQAKPPSPEIAALLHRAHYGKAKMEPDDQRRMREAVEAEIAAMRSRAPES